MSESSTRTHDEPRSTPEINHSDTGVKRVFTEVDGSTDCWLSVDPEACVPEGEWR